MNSRRKISDREAARAIDLANAAGFPNHAAEFLVVPELAKYFVGRASGRFLVQLREAADRESSTKVPAAVPGTSARTAVEAAYLKSVVMPARRGRNAALCAAIALLPFAVWYDAKALIFALPGILVAYSLSLIHISEPTRPY